MPDGTGGDSFDEPPPGSGDPGVVGDGTGETDENGDDWYGDQDPPPGDGGGDPPPGDGGDLGDWLDENPGAGGGGPYVGP
jgi:hypothetical protein